MELDNRTIQTEDVGAVAGVLVRMSNTVTFAYAEIARLKGEIVDKDKVIAELTSKCKRLIDEKNANVPVNELGQSGGNGIAAA